MKQLTIQALAIIPVFILHGTLSMLALLAYVLATATVSTTNTAKTRALEQRLNTHVTLINNAQSSANSAQSSANAAQSSANAAQSTANAAQSTANGAFQIGSTYPGTLETSGLHASGFVEADSGYLGANVVIGNQGAVSPITGGTPSSYNTSWATQVGSAVNGIINRLNSSGLT